MDKQTFLNRLRRGLSGLPREELAERLSFYSEMIDDRMEEGLSEEEAVAAVGDAEQIICQAVTDIPPKKESGHLSAGLLLLLILGSPVWLSLGVSAIAVAASLYISLWSVLISLWAVFVSLAACGLGLTVAGIVMAVCGQLLPGLALVAAAAICAGLSIFAFFACKAATDGVLRLTKKGFLWMKNRFCKKEAV